MKKLDNIDIYNNSAIILNRKTPKKIISWIFILFVLTLLFLIISFIPFNQYKSYIGTVYVNKNISYVNLQMVDFPLNKNLYINNKKYKYKIMSNEDNNLLIKIDLDNNIKINNNQVIVNVLSSKTTLFKIIKNKVKERWTNE